jgi:GT2 family glycosyltransferase
MASLYAPSAAVASHRQMAVAPAVNARPAVHAIVLNYCSLDDTLACAAAVRASHDANVRLLVVDNGSPDGSGRALARELPGDELLQLPRNTGYTGGNNAGIRVAIERGARPGLVLNPDVRLRPDAVAHYCEVLDAHPEIGALNSIQVAADGETIDPKFSAGVLAPLGYGGPRLADNDFPPLFEARSLFGAALMLPVRTLRRVGGFDPLFFAYGEETDLCRRIRRHGATLAITARAPVVHLRTPRTHPGPEVVAFLVLKGYLLYLAKDPAVPVSRALPGVLRQLAAALLGRPSRRYPFTHQRFTRGQLAHALAWFLRHAREIRAHRRLDRRGGAYL